MNSKIGISLFIIAVSVGMFACFLMFAKGGKDVTKVGFIITGETDEIGWNGLNYEGIKAACNEYGCELIVKENISENDGSCIKAVEESVNDGADMIVLTSYGYEKEVDALIQKYPDIMFYSEQLATKKKYSNLKSYFARMYQGRYLSGILAGLESKTNKIGYVAAMPNNEVNRGINAFTLGVRKVNKNASVIVAMSGAWSNEEKEKKIARELIEKENVDVMTYHQNTPAAAEVCEEYGVYPICYHTGTKNCLASVVCNWEKMYIELLKDYYGKDNEDKVNLWLGTDVGAVELADISDDVDEGILKRLEEEKQKIASGKVVFSGDIKDIDGKVRCSSGESLSEETLIDNMGWYAEGVVLYDKIHG